MKISEYLAKYKVVHVNDMKYQEILLCLECEGELSRGVENACCNNTNCSRYGVAICLAIAQKNNE